MVEIPVEKKSSLAWLWILLGLLTLGLLLWWLFADDDEVDALAPAATTATAPADAITDINPLLGANAGGLAGREVRLEGVPVQALGASGAMLVGPGGGNALLVVPEGATVPEGLVVGNMVNVMGTVRTMDALGQNRPALAGNASGDAFVAASTITMAGQGAVGTGAGGTLPTLEQGAVGTEAAGTPPTPATVAAANRRALQRLTTDPDATPRVYFAWDSAELTGGAQAVLDQLIQSRAEARTGSITLVGFADRSGPRPYNRLLSGQRAEATRRYLAGKGISPDLIGVEADGETPTRVETGNGVREPLNRRVRIELSDSN